MLSELAAGLSLAAALIAVGRPSSRTRLASLPGTQSGDRHGVGPAVLAVVALALIGSPTASFLLLAALVAGVRVSRTRAASRRRKAVTAAVIESTVALAAELRGGRSTSDALDIVATFAGPLAPVFERAARASAVGDSAGDVIAAGAEIPGAERLRWVGATWAVADVTGGRVAGVLDRLAESMDRDEVVRQELDAALAAPRATMLLLAGLPLLGIAMGESVGAGSLGILLHRPVGWALLAAAAVLDATGLVITRALSRRVLGA